MRDKDGFIFLGNGAARKRDLEAAQRIFTRIIAVDGGANYALKFKVEPHDLIGDFDSISHDAQNAFSDIARLETPDQSQTDFEKALNRFADAPVIGIGFLGKRLDHSLAVLSTLLRFPKRPILLLSSTDIAFLCPPSLSLDIPQGTRLSLMPLGAVTGRSTGLKWPIDGIEFAPEKTVGISNKTINSRVTLHFDSPKMLLFLPRALFGKNLFDALCTYVNKNNK